MLTYSRTHLIFTVLLAGSYSRQSAMLGFSAMLGYHHYRQHREAVHSLSASRTRRFFCQIDIYIVSALAGPFAQEQSLQYIHLTTYQDEKCDLKVLFYKCAVYNARAANAAFGFRQYRRSTAVCALPW